MNHHKKHRAFKIALTVSFLVTTALAIWFPDWGHYGAVAGACTNTAWLWNE